MHCDGCHEYCEQCVCVYGVDDAAADARNDDDDDGDDDDD